MKKILIATDVSLGTLNGVARTIYYTIRQLHKQGFEVKMLCPRDFRHFSCPFYKDVKLSFVSKSKLRKAIEDFGPDCVHIATEGPVGLATRNYCVKHGMNFTTSYHTNFPDYLRRMLKIPAGFTYKYLRWFHSPSSAVLSTTPSMMKELTSRGFNNLVLWSRGVEPDIFHPLPNILPDQQRPIMMYVGRVSHEKNLEAFLSLPIAGSKYIVGDGPQRHSLSVQFPDAYFVGEKSGSELVKYYSSADVFVFPSKTDTFGLVIVESLACGTPVAAYPVPGPIDIIKDANVGVLDNDLGIAVKKALHQCSRDSCVNYAKNFSWTKCTEVFINNLVKIK